MLFDCRCLPSWIFPIFQHIASYPGHNVDPGMVLQVEILPLACSGSALCYTDDTTSCSIGIQASLDASDTSMWNAHRIYYHCLDNQFEISNAQLNDVIKGLCGERYT